MLEGEIMCPSQSTPVCKYISVILQARKRILGQDGLKLPWELPLPPADKKKIGVFKKGLQALLNRKAAYRPSMHEFGELCDRLLASSTSVPPPSPVTPDSRIIPNSAASRTPEAEVIPEISELRISDTPVALPNVPKVCACEK